MSEADELRAFFASKRPPPRVDEELARRLPAMSPPTGPFHGAREQPKFATIPQTILTGPGQIPPPAPPGGGEVAPVDPATLERGRASMGQQQAYALQGQRPGFAAIPQTIMQGGALPPPMPPPGATPSVLSPQELEAIKARLAAKGEHCECKEKA